MASGLAAGVMATSDLAGADAATGVDGEASSFAWGALVK